MSEPADHRRNLHMPAPAERRPGSKPRQALPQTSPLKATGRSTWLVGPRQSLVGIISFLAVLGFPNLVPESAASAYEPRNRTAGHLIDVTALQLAAATEWRFCIAPSYQERKIYMTAPFPTTTPMEVIEDGFHRVLDRSGRRHDSVQCPTGANEQAVRAMRQHADDFNRQLGNEVVPVDWKPAATR